MSRRITVDEPVSAASTGAGGSTGPWASAGLGLLVLVLFVAAQVGCLIGLTSYTLLRDPGADPEILSNALVRTGLFFSLAGTVSAAVGTSAVILAVVSRGLDLRSELALKGVGPGVLARWTGLAALVFAGMALLGYLLGRPPVPPPVVVVYQTAPLKWWLWLAVVVAAPLFEEFFFRGFLITGLVRSRLRAGGAVLLTSAVWTAIHLQYDGLELGFLFVLGLCLGWARISTGSILPCLVMHSGFNAVSLAVCAYFL